MPESPYNLLSVTAVMQNGGKVVLSKPGARLYAESGLHIGTAKWVDRLPMLKCAGEKVVYRAAPDTKSENCTWQGGG